MTTKLTLFALIAVALVWAPLAAAEDSVESIEKAVVENWDKLASLEGAVNLKADFPMNLVGAAMSGKAPDPTITNVGKLLVTGSVDYAKKDAVICSRLEVHATLNESLKARALFVSDGAQANVEWEFFNKVDHKSLDVKNAIPSGGKALFDLLKQNFTLSAAKEDKVDGKDAYVLDAKFTTPDPNVPISKLRFWFAKDSGVLLKCEAHDLLDAVLATLTISDIKLNQPIAPDRFKYTPPAPAPAPETKPTEEAKPAPATSPAAAPAKPAK